MKTENREGTCTPLFKSSTTTSMRETPGLSIQEISSLTAISRAAKGYLQRSWNLYHRTLSTNLLDVCSETVTTEKREGRDHIVSQGHRLKIEVLN